MTANDEARAIIDSAHCFEHVAQDLRCADCRKLRDGVKAGVTNVRAESLTWPRHGRFVACPECGKFGMAGGIWTLIHDDHVRCVCGQTVTRAGLNKHIAQVRRHVGWHRGTDPKPDA